MIGVVGHDHQRASGERRLALPDARQQLAIGGRPRHVVRPDEAQTEPALPASLRRNVRQARILLADELQRRPWLVIRLRRRPQRGHPLGDGAMRSRQLVLRRMRPRDPLQALVRVGDTRQLVQDALVDAQRRGHQHLARPHLDHLPVTQRTGRRDRAPMGAGQRRKCETEGRPRIAAAGFMAQRGKRRVELDAGTHEQQIALEDG